MTFKKSVFSFLFSLFFAASALSAQKSYNYDYDDAPQPSSGDGITTYNQPDSSIQSYSPGDNLPRSYNVESELPTDYPGHDSAVPESYSPETKRSYSIERTDSSVRMKEPGYDRIRERREAAERINAADQNPAENPELEEGLLPEMGTYFETEDSYGKVTGFVNLRIVQNRFRLYFMDKDKKIIEPLYEKAYVRFEDPDRNYDNQTVALSPLGDYLTSSRIIKKPHRFYFNLILKDDSGKKPMYLPRRLLNQLGNPLDEMEN